MKNWTIYDGVPSPHYQVADFVWVNEQGDLCGYKREGEYSQLLWAFKAGYWTSIFSPDDRSVMVSKTHAVPRAN